jgi:hypothetical protein
MTQTPEAKAAAAEAARLMLYYRLTPEMVLAIEDYQRVHGMGILMGTSTMSTGTEHDHTTGLVRGRMDFRLNRALGMIEAFTAKLSYEDMRSIGVGTKDAATAKVLRLMADYMTSRPAVQAVGAVFGLIGKAKRKRKMIYGSPSGPMKPIITKKRIKREKTSSV